MNEPKVCILLLNYNRWKDTIDCIKSIKEINYSNYDILLIDNCSTDDSYERFIKSFQDINLEKTAENLGYTGGINFGINVALTNNPDYILILNNDTLVDKSFLSHLVEGIENEKDIAAACGTILTEHNREEIWYASGEIIAWRGLAVHNNKGEKFLIENYNGNVQTNFITGCMVLLKSELISKIGLEDERFFMYLDDIEYSIRIKEKGFSLLYVPQSIIYHKVFGEKESSFKLYYSVRNRLLLINTSLKGLNKLMASVYFIAVIIIKLFVWNFNNRIFFRAALLGLKDYFRGNFYKGNGGLFFNQ